MGRISCASSIILDECSSAPRCQAYFGNGSCGRLVSFSQGPKESIENLRGFGGNWKEFRMPRSAEESEPVREDDLVCQYERLEFCVIAHDEALQPPASSLPMMASIFPSQNFSFFPLDNRVRATPATPFKKSTEIKPLGTATLRLLRLFLWTQAGTANSTLNVPCCIERFQQRKRRWCLARAPACT